MPANEKMRSTVRLRIYSKGSVTLHRSDIPTVMCPLLDLSEAGCRCSAPPTTAEVPDLDSWKTILRTGEKFDLEVTFEPHLPYIHLVGEIRQLTSNSNVTFEFGMAFIDTTPEQSNSLKRAMESIALEKIRTQPSVLKSGTTGVYDRPSPGTSDFPPKLVTGDRDYFQDMKIGEVLEKMGKMTEAQVSGAVRAARLSGEKLGQYLLREGLVNSEDLCQARSLQSGLPVRDITGLEIGTSTLQLFPYSVMKQFDFVPFEVSAGKISIAAANPIPQPKIQELEGPLGKKIDVFLAKEDLIKVQLQKIAKKFDRHRRKKPRYRIAMQCSYQFAKADGNLIADSQCRGKTIDLSEGGFRIQGPIARAVSSDSLMTGQIRLLINVTVIPQDIVSYCEVRYLRPAKGAEMAGPTYVMGLMATQMSGAHKKILEELIQRVSRGGAQLDEDRDEGLPNEMP